MREAVPFCCTTLQTLRLSARVMVPPRAVHLLCRGMHLLLVVPIAE